ncbi:uncharacterized protein METZ01_LOCUS310979 [marine metagenome]|uniref:Uncharacterized protein n=1 Tax=marine metagenome TaxID=408172 RepID=A0A382NCS5_9ZZZZ
MTAPTSAFLSRHSAERSWVRPWRLFIDPPAGAMSV